MVEEKDPQSSTPEGYRVIRLLRAARKLIPYGQGNDEVTEALEDKLLENPDNFTQPNPDESETPNSETVIYQYGASVSWLAFNHIQNAIKELNNSGEFPDRTFRIVNKNWPYRHTYDLVGWLQSSLQWGRGAGLFDGSTSSIPFYNPMLPSISPDGPPHSALLVMGGNDMLEDLEAVKLKEMSPKEFSDGMFERTKTIIEAMREAGFQRVAVVPLNRKNVPNIINSLEIPSEMVDALEVAYQRIAEAFPDFVYMSPHDLYEGLTEEHDYLDSPQEYPLTERWEERVYDLVKRKDREYGRQNVHPNPYGQFKVGKIMADTVSEMARGFKSPCLKHSMISNPDVFSDKPEPNSKVEEVAQSGVVTDIAEQRQLAL